MCAAAFSSNSVLQNVIPLLPTSDFSSTSATSPSSDAFASTANSPRTSSAPVEALTSSDAAVLEDHLQVPDDGAADQDERLGRPYLPRGAAVVRGGEHLFGRKVRHVELTPRGLDAGRCPVGNRQQADGQVGPGAAEAHRVEAALVQLPRPLLQHRDVRLPGGDRVVLAQAHRPANGVPQPRDVRLAEDLLGPTRRREGDDRPSASARGRPRSRSRGGSRASPSLRRALWIDAGEDVPALARRRC